MWEESHYVSIDTALISGIPRYCWVAAEVQAPWMSLQTLWGGAVLLPSKHEGPGSLLGFLGHHSSRPTS